MQQHDIGLIGLAVMGRNLALNIERNGFSMAVYNRTASTTTTFADGPAAGKNIAPTYTLEDFFGSLEKPCVIIIMVKAGAPVDDVIAHLLPHLAPGDIVIDGGNSHFQDTERRSEALKAKGLYFFGVGISGGEEGALLGPSIMPGGPEDAYDAVRPLFENIAAKVNGEPCVGYMGPRGAGHFVKMVHNAIEYADMQLIAEAYDILRRGLCLSAGRLHKIFEEWNKGLLSSYLIDITARIMKRRDDETNKPLVDLVLDAAEQKGTGKWASHAALELGVPVPTINAAVESRCISSDQLERSAVSKAFPISTDSYTGDKALFIDALRDALYASKICSYAQGIALLCKASTVYQYHLNCSEIARIWRGGCIIRARFLDDIQSVFKENPGLTNLLVAPCFQKAVVERLSPWRHVVQTSVRLGIPIPGMSGSLAYFDAYRSNRLPANLIQAQRDYFGAHTYRRVDLEGLFHTQWSSESPSV